MKPIEKSKIRIGWEVTVKLLIRLMRFAVNTL